MNDSWVSEIVEKMARAMQGANALLMLRDMPWDDCEEREREHWKDLAHFAFLSCAPNVLERVIKELEAVGYNGMYGSDIPRLHALMIERVRAVATELGPGASRPKEPA